MNNNQKIRDAAAGDVDLIGFADLEALEKEYDDLFENMTVRFPRAVVMGKALAWGVLDTIGSEPTHAYFHHYRQVNSHLDRVALLVSSLIEQEGFKALPIGASQLIGRKPMKAYICHRRIGWQAGLGNRGLNNLLVTPEYGSAVRFVTILTDMPFETGTPVDEGCDFCGDCINVCPAAAIGSQIDDFCLEKCSAKLDEFSKIPFISQHICGVCISACRGKRK